MSSLTALVAAIKEKGVRRSTAYIAGVPAAAFFGANARNWDYRLTIMQSLSLYKGTRADG
jgi:hypothetical protein